MSKCCVSCGAPLPDSHPHRNCSMCYGDPDYGTDGYYREYLEEMERQEWEKREYERQEWERRERELDREE